MPKQSTHPSREELSAYSLGQLPQDKAVAIDSHISECRPCCETIVDLSSDDTFVGLLREAKQLPTDQTVDQDGLPAKPSSPDVPAPLAAHPRYEILGLIGKGGMGDVYKAEHRMMERTVALKVINREFVRKAEAVDRFHREVKTAAQLSHPNIVTSHDAEQAGDVHFLVMEYVDGIDLSHTVKQRGALPIADACDYIRQAAIGLQHAHELGMVHRDIKPHNLMVTADGTVKILDFGLASLAPVALSDADTVEARGDLTAAGAIMGTPDFISPEQADDARQADIRSDIYSLGATLYFLLSGRPPFTDGSVMHKLKSHAQVEPDKLESLRDDIPADLAAVVTKMMAKDADERFQKPADVAEALESFSRASQPVQEHSPPLQVRPGRQRSRILKLTAVATLFVAAIVAGVVYYIQTNNGTVRVEVTDPSMEVTISGRTIKMKDGNKDPLEIRAGECVLIVRQGDFEFETNNFQIRRNEDIAFKVERRDGEVVVSKDGEKFKSMALSEPDGNNAMAKDTQSRQKENPRQDPLSGREPAEQTEQEKMVEWLLENVPGTRENLAKSYIAKGEEDKAKKILKRVPAINPEAAASLEFAKILEKSGDSQKATDAYLDAFRKAPSLLHLECFGVFKKAKRMPELAQVFTEENLKQLPYANPSAYLVKTMLEDEATRADGYELMKRVWATQERYHSDLLLNLPESYWREAPDPIYYVRLKLIPADIPSEGAGWKRFTVVQIPDQDAGGGGNLAQIKPLFQFHDRAMLRQLAEEVEAGIEQHSGWKAGVALLCVVEAEAGNYERAAELLEQVLEDAERQLIPSDPAWMIGQALEGKDPELDRLAMRLYEHSMVDRPGRALRESALTNLAKLYAKFDRKPEARQLLYRLANDDYDPQKGVVCPSGRVPENANRCTECHRRERNLYDVTAMSDTLTDIGFPVHALVSLARIDSSFWNAFSSNEEWAKETAPSNLDYRYAVRPFRRAKSNAESAVTPQAVLKALNAGVFAVQSTGDQAATAEPENSGDVFDLMLSVRGEAGLPTVFSATLDVLQLAAKSNDSNAKSALLKIDARLANLLAQHPNSIESGIAATVFAFLRDDLDLADARLKKLQALRAAGSKDPQPDDLGLWLAARHALANDSTKAIGEQLADRALAAADKQSDPLWKNAMLRERKDIMNQAASRK